MKLPKLAIDNHQFTIVVFALLLTMGISSFLTMPRTEDPPMNIPGASVIVVYPGSNPVDLEELVVDPIEEAINELDDIKVMTAKMRDGIANVSVEFTFNTDAGDKFGEVVRQVTNIRDELPDGIIGPEILEWSSTDVVILQLALLSRDASYRRLDRRAGEIRKRLEKLPGVRLVESYAIPEQEVRVSLDPEKMARMNIPVDRVEQAIQSNNANIPGGSVKISGKNFNIKSSGSYSSLRQIEETVVSSYEGRLVYLRDIATVHFDYEDIAYKARVNQRRAVFITVKQKEGYNIFDVMDGVNESLAAYEEELDTDIELYRVFDQTGSVDRRINGFLNNLLQGIILVGLLVILTLGTRASILVILAIPFSIILGLSFVDLAGFGLQQISIAALVIALGLLVDNSIVIVENIERFIKSGLRKRDASIHGASQLGWPIVSATATTMLAFIPIIMMPDKAGKFIQSLPVTVIFTLLASLLLALTLTPYLARVFLKPKPKEEKKERGFKKLVNGLIEGPYRNTLHYALTRPWLVVFFALLALAGAGFLFTRVGVSFFPKAEKPQFLVRVHAPENASIDRADSIARYVESVLDTLPGLRHYATNVGHGNPRIYYNTFPKQYERNFAEIYVELEEYEVRRFDTVIARLRKIFREYPGARINIKEFEQGAPIEAPLTVKITGTDLDRLKRIADDLEVFVRRQPGVVNIGNELGRNSTDLFFRINRDKAGMYGVPVVNIDRTIRTAINGMRVSGYRDSEGEEYDIVMRLPFYEQIRVEDFDRIHVSSMSGRQIPLKQLAAVEMKSAPGVIAHYNLDRAATITGDLEKGVVLDDVIESLGARFDAYPWPEGYEYKYTGELESREESFGGMTRAGIIAVLAILAVLVLQFRSFVQPLIIFSALPLAVIGSTLALFITGYTFSFTAFIGFISLIGIVVNNSIILVDYTNALRREGKSIPEALAEAGEVRFRPIILTTLTTIGGLLPLTLRGGTMWAPMGWTIIGGLLVSTFLTLVVVPVLYKLFVR